jgi:transcriptional regulator with XRE-family HTH domain
MPTVNDVLKTARESLGLSQESVAAEIRRRTGHSFSRAALAQIESGVTKNPTAKNLQAACDTMMIDFRQALEGRLVWLDRDTGEASMALALADNGTEADPRKKALFALFDALPKSEQEAVMADLTAKKRRVEQIYEEMSEQRKVKRKA